MRFLKFLIGVIAVVLAFVIAINLLALLLKLIGFVFSILWLAIVVGLFVLIAWVIYRIIWSSRAAQL
jgi:hypothetical protein